MLLSSVEVRVPPPYPESREAPAVHGLPPSCTEHKSRMPGWGFACVRRSH